METITSLPWNFIATGFGGFVLYIVMTLTNPADDSLASIGDVFIHRGKTVLGGAIATVALILLAKDMNQLNYFSAFFGGYFNLSALKKSADIYMNKDKLLGGN